MTVRLVTLQPDYRAKAACAFLQTTLGVAAHHLEDTETEVPHKAQIALRSFGVHELEDSSPLHAHHFSDTVIAMDEEARTHIFNEYGKVVPLYHEIHKNTTVDVPAHTPTDTIHYLQESASGFVEGVQRYTQFFR